MTANTQHVFNTLAQSRIDAAITASDVSITLIPGGAVNFLPGWTSSKEFYCTLVDASANREIIKVTAISGDIFTIERGQDGTSARAWPAGSLIDQRLVAANADRFIQKGFRTVTYNPNGVLSGAYDGEKVYQSNSLTWWINISGTIWTAMTSSDDITSTVTPTLDGTISRTGGSSFATTRNAGTGTVVTPGITSYIYAARCSKVTGLYSIGRAFFSFDISSLDIVSITSASLFLTSLSGYNTDAVIQKGTQGVSLTSTDYDAFTGAVLATKSFSTGLNEMIFNSDGLAYLTSVIDSVAYFCLRQQTKDYDNVPPTTSNNLGLHYAETTNDSDKPILSITYSDQ